MKSIIAVSIGFLFLAACSDSNESLLEDSDEKLSTETDNAESTSSTEVEIDGEPVVGNVPSDQIFEDTNSLGRTFMDADRVDLFWTEVEDATSYSIYRAPTNELDYNTLPDGDIGSAQVVYEGSDLEFSDTSAPADTFLTYFVIAELENMFTTPRWTEALTTADTTPPADITGLTGEVTDEGVLLTWEPSSDNLEFAGYNVSYISPNGVADYLGGGADIGQTSFIDANPRDGENLYVVTATDFHKNVSERVEITVEWAG